MIKTRINHPFMYFFMEPNVVFVYKVETNDYLTVSDLMKGLGWDTYEIDDSADFETFHHEEREPLKGRGYIINQDTLNAMTGEINKHIHTYKALLQEEIIPVHIVASESAAGSIRVGLDRPKKVIGFQDIFSIGPLWNLHHPSGQTYRSEWFYDHINLELKDDYYFSNQFTNTLLEIEDIPEHAPIYVWTANNAEEQIGLRLILYLLKDKANDVYVMNSTEPVTNYTSLLPPEELKRIFEHKKTAPPLTHHDKVQYQNDWEQLSQSKDVLRVWVSNEITDAPENYYDSLILDSIQTMHEKQDKKDFIKAGSVIAEIMDQQDPFMNVFYLEYRIRDLIYNGALELKGVPRSMRHYRVRLR